MSDLAVNINVLVFVPHFVQSSSQSFRCRNQNPRRDCEVPLPSPWLDPPVIATRGASLPPGPAAPPLSLLIQSPNPPIIVSRGASMPPGPGAPPLNPLIKSSNPPIIVSRGANLPPMFGVPPLNPRTGSPTPGMDHSAETTMPSLTIINVSREWWPLSPPFTIAVLGLSCNHLSPRRDLIPASTNLLPKY